MKSQRSDRTSALTTPSGCSTSITYRPEISGKIPASCITPCIRNLKRAWNLWETRMLTKVPGSSGDGEQSAMTKEDTIVQYLRKVTKVNYVPINRSRQKRKWKLSMEAPMPPKQQVSEILLESFAEYCGNHPEQRFWQALRNWSKRKFIYADGMDTFYWEGRYGYNKKAPAPMHRYKVKPDKIYSHGAEREERKRCPS